MSFRLAAHGFEHSRDRWLDTILTIDELLSKILFLAHINLHRKISECRNKQIALIAETSEIVCRWMYQSGLVGTDNSAVMFIPVRREVS